MWSHSPKCLDHRNKTHIYTFALSSIGFYFSLSSFPSWALDHHHMWPFSSFHVINITDWVPPCSIIGLYQPISYHISWQRLVHRFHQLSKTKLGLLISPFLVIDDNLFTKIFNKIFLIHVSCPSILPCVKIMDKFYQPKLVVLAPPYICAKSLDLKACAYAWIESLGE
jgi:hypothetical protein